MRVFVVGVLTLLNSAKIHPYIAGKLNYRIGGIFWLSTFFRCRFSNILFPLSSALCGTLFFQSFSSS